MEDKLAAGSDIYLCDRRELDISMTKISNPHRRWLNGGSRLFSFSNEADLISTLVNVTQSADFLAT